MDDRPADSSPPQALPGRAVGKTFQSSSRPGIEGVFVLYIQSSLNMLWTKWMAFVSRTRFNFTQRRGDIH